MDWNALVGSLVGTVSGMDWNALIGSLVGTFFGAVLVWWRESVREHYENKRKEKVIKPFRSAIIEFLYYLRFITLDEKEEGFKDKQNFGLEKIYEDYINDQKNKNVGLYYHISTFMKTIGIVYIETQKTTFDPSKINTLEKLMISGTALNGLESCIADIKDGYYDAILLDMFKIQT